MGKMRGIYTWTSFLIILMSGSSLCQHHVCLKYKDRGDTIDIICSVDRLKYQIMFKNPAGEENGKCGAPFRVGEGIVFCNGKFNINEDLTTNTTTLIIEKNKLMYGEWKCYHGTHIGFDSLDIKMTDVKDSNSRWEIIIPLIIVITILLVPACFGVYNFVVYIKDMARRFSLKKDTKTDKIELIGKPECVPKCTSCNLMSICAICIDCKKMFCEICCNTHDLSSKPRHKVCIIEHVTTSNYEVNCAKCSNMATSGCLQCVVVLCYDCTREHLENNHNVKMLIKYNGVAYHRGNTKNSSTLKHKHTISEENVKQPNKRGKKTKRRKNLINCSL